MSELRPISLTVNGQRHDLSVEPRHTLADVIRTDLGLTGTHLGCEHGVCGACTLQVDGRPVRSCLMLAVQADGRSIRTVEGLALDGGEELHPLQEAFRECHGLQCGFCTPGLLMSLEPFIRGSAALDDHTVREAMAGNLCRCTGYESIAAAVKLAAERVRGRPSGSEVSRATSRSTNRDRKPDEGSRP